MKVIWPVELVVVSAVMWHLILGPQHALVWNTSVATMTKLIHKTIRGFEQGRVVDAWLNSALRITLKQSPEFLVGGRLEVRIIEGCTKGIEVSCEDSRVWVRKRNKGHFNLCSSFGFK